jgi:hypothetical protein
MTRIKTAVVVGAMLTALTAPARAAQSDPDEVLYGDLVSGSDSTFVRYEFRCRLMVERELTNPFARGRGSASG